MSEPRRTPTAWTRRLQISTAIASAVFTVGTAVQNFVIIDHDMIAHSMRLAGLSSAEAVGQAPGMLTFLRAVGTVFIIGNALGILALRGRTWVCWTALVVNAGQAAGPLGMIPSVVYRSTIDLYGPLGILPTAITDGGALLLTLALLVSLIRFRTPWAHRTYAPPSTADIAKRDNNH